MAAKASPAAAGARQSPSAHALASRTVIDAYFGKDPGMRLVEHNIDSFDDVAGRKLGLIIEAFNPIEINHQYLGADAVATPIPAPASASAPAPALGADGDNAGSLAVAVAETPGAGAGAGAGAAVRPRFKHTLSISLENTTLSKPTIYEKNGSTKVMMPNDARLRNLTYAAPINVDVVATARMYNTETGEQTSETRRIPGVCIGRIPIMVRSRFCMLTQQPSPSRSDECCYDHGGYFIVNGNEKVVISQDRIAENRTYVFSVKASTYSHQAEIRSVQEVGVPKTTALKLTSKANQFGRCIRVSVHHIKHDVPLFIMFRALGVETDHDIVRHIAHGIGADGDGDGDGEGGGGDDGIDDVVARELVASADEAAPVRTQAQALEYLGRYLQLHGQPRALSGSSQHRLAVLPGVLRRELLPHVGTDPHKKALYLGHMARRLLHCLLGLREFDDRDSYINKRLDTPGVLLANLFRQYFAKVRARPRTGGEGGEGCADRLPIAQQSK
jgi:DNA-directed RNA polymerase beta subunit